jgi:FixJ family two-component response regulator
VSGTPLIAVVDDEEPIRRALNRLLRSAGMTVETFATGDAFLESLASHRPDCVVLDLHMPATDGFEVQARMNASDRHVPTIVITGHEQPDTQQRAFQGGASAMLRKPFDGQALINAIETAIAGE